MIPQEKIEQAEKEYAVSIWGEVNSTQFINAFSTQSKTDFTAGVRFAEEELKQRAQQFAEWIDKSVYYISDTTVLWVSVLGRVKHMQLTTAELYAKFEAEMNQQNNGG